MTEQDVLRKHPLATKQGISTFVQLVEAGETWRRATTAQKKHLREQCKSLIAAIQQGDIADQDQLERRMPVLAALAPATVRSMQEKGLLDAYGRVTLRALHATFWMAQVERTH